jgi:hypothetical protein
MCANKQIFVFLHDLIDPETGKSYKEENLEIKHQIPIGSLVEVRWDEWFGGAGWKVHARLWVVSHDRDVDGTPLYSLSRWKDISFAKEFHQIHSGFDEDQLKLIELTEDIQNGIDVLEWTNKKNEGD